MNHAATKEKPILSRSKTMRSRGAMGNALSASLDAETSSFQARLQKAENALVEPSKKVPVENDEKSIISKSDKKSAPKVVASIEVPHVVRDAFTMPGDDYALIAHVQQRCLQNALRVTKSEALRAGLQSLALMNDEELVGAFTRIEKVRVGGAIVSSRLEPSGAGE